VKVNINEVVSSLCQLLAGTVGRKVRIGQNLSAHNAVVVGDPTQLRNALLGIGMNGCEAMPGGGDLIFETATVESDEVGEAQPELAAQYDSFVRCSVIDTGEGMDESVRSRIFEPFFTTKGMGRSVGMGLASAYGCIRNHRGFIDVSSEPGKGARFDVYLPCAREDGTEILTSDVEEREPVKGSGRVMVVDDDPGIHTIMKDVLTDLGYSVRAFGTGAEATDFYLNHSNEVDVVILDVVMRDCSGAQCFARLREINPAARVVVMTGYGVADQVDGLLRGGALAFIPKPIDFTLLSHLVHRALNAPPQ
jgi:CheY-like chemotaxis protein